MGKSLPMLGKTIARNTFWIALDTLFGMVAAAAISITAARLLGPRVLGYYNYVIWIAGLTSILVTLGVPAATNRFVAEYVGRGEIGRSTGRRQDDPALPGVDGGSHHAPRVRGDLWHNRREASSLRGTGDLSLAPHSVMAIFAAAINATEDSFYNVWPSFVGNVVNVVGTIGALSLGWSLVGLATMLLLSRSVDCSS